MLMLVKLEKLVFYLLVFCLPLQTRKLVYQFGPEFNEWTGAYLYLTDLLVFALFGLWLWRNRKNRFFKQIKPFGRQIKTPYFWLAGFLLIALFSLVNARNLGLGFYHWLKLIQLTGLFFYLAFNLSLFRINKIAVVLAASGVFQSLLGWLQFVGQKSLGLWFFGESPLGGGIKGVAKIISQGTEIVRAYGVFPHPNLLAAFLLVSILFSYYLWLQKSRSQAKSILLAASYGWLLTGLLFSFSRSVIAVFILVSLGFFLAVLAVAKKQNNSGLLKRLTGLVLIIVSYGILLGFLAWPELSSRFAWSSGQQAVSLRLFYSDFAWQLVNQHPWLGIGWGNFVWEIQAFLDLLSVWLHQPVHNIYLLVAAQSGLLGLALFLLFIFYLIRKGRKNYFFPLIIFSLLLLGLFDHYLLTLQQGQLLFWLVLGLGAGWLKEKSPFGFF